MSIKHIARSGADTWLNGLMDFFLELTWLQTIISGNFFLKLQLKFLFSASSLLPIAVFGSLSSSDF